MKTIMRTVSEICGWLKAMRERSQERRVQKRTEAINRESLRMVQVKEFGGVVYVSYDGVPLVDVNSIVDNIPEALDDVRATYVEWMEKERR